MVRNNGFMQFAATLAAVTLVALGFSAPTQAQCCQPPPGAEAAPTATAIPVDRPAPSPTAAQGCCEQGTPAAREKKSEEISSAVVDHTSVDLRRYFEQIGADGTLWFQHVQALACPAFEGREPGTEGIKRAADYIEFYLRAFGLAPPFAASQAPGSADKSYRQPFTLEGDATANPASSTLTFGDNAMIYGQDFVLAANSRSGSARGPAAFVGYAIEEGPNGYSSFASSADLSGRIAIMFRLEPLKHDGSFRWSEGPGSASSLISKLSAVAARGAAGILIVSPPGAQHELPALESIAGLGSACGTIPAIPAAVITQSAAEKLLRQADPESRDLMAWRRRADEGTVKTVALDDRVIVDLRVNVQTRTIPTENVAAALPGKGRLASEWIVIGGHYDHVGQGHARAANDRGVLLGADDNASGTAMVLLLAKRLSHAYANAAPDAELRSILFVTFTAEEMGLNGSRHFVKNSPVPLGSLFAMLNFDAVGRMQQNNLWIHGVGSAEEFPQLIGTLIEQSGLNVTTDQPGGASDQLSFEEAGVPVLYFTTGMHDEYHTSADLAHTVDPAGAGKILDLAERVVANLSKSPGKLTFGEQSTKWSSWCSGNKKSGNAKPCAPNCCQKPASGSPSEPAAKPKCCG